jgi:hypothetical protein
MGRSKLSYHTTATQFVYTNQLLSHHTDHQILKPTNTTSNLLMKSHSVFTTIISPHTTAHSNTNINTTNLLQSCHALVKADSLAPNVNNQPIRRQEKEQYAVHDDF